MDLLNEVIIPIREKIKGVQGVSKDNKRAEKLNIIAQIGVLRTDLEKLRAQTSSKIDAKRAERDAVLDKIIDKLGLKFNISVLARPVVIFNEQSEVKSMDGEVITTSSFRDMYGNRVFAREVIRDVPEKKVFELDLRESRRMEKRLLAKTDVHDFVSKYMVKDNSLSWLVDKFYPNAQRGRLAKVIKELDEDYAGETRSSLEVKYNEARVESQTYPKKLEKQRNIVRRFEDKSERNPKVKAKYEEQLAILREIEEKMAFAKKAEERALEGLELFGKKARIEKQIKQMEEMLSTPELKDLLAQFDAKLQEFNLVMQETKPTVDSANEIEKKIKSLQKKSSEIEREIYDGEIAPSKEVENLICEEIQKLVDGVFGQKYSIEEINDSADEYVMPRKIDNIEAKIITELLDQMESANEKEME